MTSLTLRSYLDTRRTTGADWNITGLGTGQNGWLGKYAVPDDEYDAFLQLTHDHIFVKGKACSLLEKHKAQGPILIDLDFRYAAGGPLRRRFTNEQVREFVAAYADAISRFFGPLTDASDEPVPLRFFVMLKPSPEADKETHKDGVHIVCPSITTAPEMQYAIRGYLLQTGAVERIFGSTGMTNPPQDCIDLSVIQRNNWFLYGACKPDKAWYKVEQVYSVTIPEEYTEQLTGDHLEEESIEASKPLELIKLLSIREGHDSVTPLSLRTNGPATDADWIQLLQRWGKGSNWAKAKSPGLFAKLPTASPPPELNLESGGTPTPVSTNAADDMIQVSGMSVRSGYSSEDIALAYKLVRECLNPERRCGEYQDWINTGMCLKNINNKEESFRVWMELTRRTSTHHKKAHMSDAELMSKWRLIPAEDGALRSGRKPLLMGTLHLWAKEDSPSAYRMILNEANTEIAFLNDSGTHVSVADLVVRMYRHEFRCTPGRKGATATSMDWYQFPADGHTWRELKTWMRLRERLSTDVRNVYLAADVKVMQREMATNDQSERERLQEKRKKLLKVETSLQGTGFKDNVMKESAEKFYDEDFIVNMNEDSSTIGFSNGVLELRKPGNDGQPHVHFRPGRPDDCISFQMGRGIVGLDSIPYIAYDPANPMPEHLELVDFFEKIYPDPVLREYVLTLYSACLEGCNHEQKFYIMQGCGGNGKSKIIDLMSKTFGEYQETLPVQAITRKRADAGSANPELIVIKNKRYVTMVEPEEGERINTSYMKQITGGDPVKARGLFKDQDVFVVKARIFMSCNDLPPVSSMDEGTWRRIYVLPHVSRFVEQGKPTNPAAYVFPRDPLLDSKITRWRPYFAGMLVWYYENKYLRGGLSVPACVMAASDKYKEENDAFAAFAQECLVKEDGAETRANDVLVRWKDWKKYNPGFKDLQKKDLLAKMTEMYGKPIDPAGKVYMGVRIAEEGEDISGNYIETI